MTNEITKKYYTGTNDYVFFSMITRYPEYLKDMIETLYDIKLGDFHFENNRQIKKYLEGRAYNLDIIIKDGYLYVNLECNNYWDEKTKSRNFVFATNSYSNSYLIGEEEFKNKLIQINLIKKNTKEKEAIFKYKIYDIKHKKEYLENLEFCNVYLDKLKEMYYNNNNKLTQYQSLIIWSLNEQELKELSKESEYMRRFKERLDALNNDEEIYQIMSDEQELKFKMKAARNDGREEGYEEGKEEGKEEGFGFGFEQGIEQSTIKLAKKMKEKDYTLKEISDITSLSISTLEQL